MEDKPPMPSQQAFLAVALAMLCVSNDWDMTESDNLLEVVANGIERMPESEKKQELIKDLNKMLENFESEEE